MPRPVASARSAASARSVASARTALSNPTHMQTGTLFEEFETGWALVSGGTVTQNSAERFKTGTGSLKCVTTSGTQLFAGKTINRSLADVTSIGGWVYVESPIGDVKQTVQISVVFYFFLAGFAGSIVTINTYLSLNHGWNYVQFGRDQWTLTSATPADTFTTMRIKVNAYSGQVLTVYFDSLYFNRRARPTVMIEFDDGWDSTYDEAFAYMSARGLLGNILLVPGFVGQANRVTLAEVQEMYDAGWDILNHTNTHPTMTAYTEAQAALELNNCRDYIAANVGTRRNQHLMVATPTGGYGAGVLAALANNGYLSCRHGEGELSPPFVDNIYHDKCFTILGIAATAASIIAGIDRAVSAGMSTRLIFHRLTDGAAADQTELIKTTFRPVMDNLAKRNGNDLDVVTETQNYGLQNGQRLPVAA